MKFLLNLKPSNAHHVRTEIEENGAEWANKWYELMKPFIWLASYFSFYTFSEGSFHFRRLPFHGQFIFVGQQRFRDRKSDPVKRDWRWKRPSIGFTVYGGDSNLDFSCHFCFILFGIYLTFENILPKKFQFQYQSKNYGSLPCERQFSFYYNERAIWLQIWDNEDDYNAKQTWINKMHVFHFPWEMDWVRTSKLRVDGTWYDETYKTRLPWKEKQELEKSQNLWEKTLPYQYQLRSGEIQNVEATISVEEREWRWRWFKWLPFPRKISKTIDIRFSAEVGEETGSWKGGCTGCGYKMLPNETPVQCLRRMEKERSF